VERRADLDAGRKKIIPHPARAAESAGLLLPSVPRPSARDRPKSPLKQESAALA
jgi:hypothetical protein